MCNYDCKLREYGLCWLRNVSFSSAAGKVVEEKKREQYIKVLYKDLLPLLLLFTNSLFVCPRMVIKE